MSWFEVASPVQVPRLLTITTVYRPPLKGTYVNETQQSRISPQVLSYDLASHYVGIPVNRALVLRVRTRMDLCEVVSEARVRMRTKRFSIMDSVNTSTPCALRLPSCWFLWVRRLPMGRFHSFPFQSGY